MSLPLIFASLWVVAGTLVAFLPMRLQYAPGFLLLCAAPPLLFWIAQVHGAFLAAAGVLAFLSMFRRPIGYVLVRGMRHNAETPE